MNRREEEPEEEEEKAASNQWKLNRVRTTEKPKELFPISALESEVIYGKYICNVTICIDGQVLLTLQSGFRKLGEDVINRRISILTISFI